MRRQRADGTYTFSTPEWDEKWYWPVGTAVILRGEQGVVSKVNSVTVDVTTPAGLFRRVSVKALRRVVLKEV